MSDRAICWTTCTLCSHLLIFLFAKQWMIYKLLPIDPVLSFSASFLYSSPMLQCSVYVSYFFLKKQTKTKNNSLYSEWHELWLKWHTVVANNWLEKCLLSKLQEVAGCPGMKWVTKRVQTDSVLIAVDANRLPQLPVVYMEVAERSTSAH